MATPDKWNTTVEWAADTKKNIKEGKVGMDVTLLYIAAVFILITVIIFVSVLIYKRMSAKKGVEEVREEINTAIPSTSVENDSRPPTSATNPTLFQKMAEVDFVRADPTKSVPGGRSPTSHS